MVNVVIYIVIGYLLGAIPFGYLAAKWFRGIDIREHGSRNIGATNVLRVCGKSLGIPVLLLDICKGAAAVTLASASMPDHPWLPVACGAAAMAGHCFSPFIGFKGGKAVATGAGVFGGLAWEALAIALLVFVLTLIASRYISLSSMLAALTLALVLIVETLFVPSWAHPLSVTVAGCLAAAFVVIRHRANIVRLRAGTENRFRFSSK